MVQQLGRDGANIPSKADGLLTTTLYTSSIVTIGSTPGSDHGHLGECWEVQAQLVRSPALCSLPPCPLTPSRLPGPHWFSQLPLTTSWKLTPKLSDSDRSSDPCQRKRKEAWFQQGSIYAPLGGCRQASTLLCCESTHRPLQVHSSLFQKAHVLTW